ncbi:MAG: hypothetical protein IPP07_24930 [Holophagales bacterium]|nr:hypothetical protein [Holophagales bacterium]MBK9967941.1 hypothetical protein [Holophagales bacterium]
MWFVADGAGVRGLQVAPPHNSLLVRRRERLGTGDAEHHDSRDREAGRDDLLLPPFSLDELHRQEQGAVRNLRR